MAAIKFPKQLDELLKEGDNSLYAPVRSLADKVGEILDDNAVVFFPEYTDHGTKHVNLVLKSEVELVPKEVWKNSTADNDPQLLCDADAAIIIGATLLHDIAMHLSHSGLMELVSRDSRFKPLEWFCDDHEEYMADRPWHELWQDYILEVRRFSDRNLINIIGADSLHSGWSFREFPENWGCWDNNHKRLAGEFIRRHHARLAHEIAMYGFPGLEDGSARGQFPAIGRAGHDLEDWGDLIGLTARSHGMSLRVCQAYLEESSLHGGALQPSGSAVLYPMALLRVADYFQIDHKRAPEVLLQLKNPQSPISVDEWNKHKAVRHISQSKDDPRAKIVTVDKKVILSTYLQLEQLLKGLQAELDHSTAVLDEAYGRCTDEGLDKLKLSCRRVKSNMHTPEFKRQLPYLPERTGFAADPNILTLLVEPLYGKYPSVGVRELMQNSVDAVRELHAWCEKNDVAVDSLDLPELAEEADVLIEFIQREDESWILRVQDKGIGMKPDTIKNYFLKAGASFRQSTEWTKDFVNEDGKVGVLRSGRFGVGAFATFLLGDKFKMWTRHVSVEKSEGYMLEAAVDSSLIKIERVDDIQVGTVVEVDLSGEAVLNFSLDNEMSGGDSFANATDWFCYDYPKVVRMVRSGDGIKKLRQNRVMDKKRDVWRDWFELDVDDFDKVFWSFLEFTDLAYNGIKVKNPPVFYGFASWLDFKDFRYMRYYDGSKFKNPRIVIDDSNARLGLNIQRYNLSSEFTFSEKLRSDIWLSFIAHALVCSSISSDDFISQNLKHPLCIRIDDDTNTNGVVELGERLSWSVDSRSFVPTDKWLLRAQGNKKVIVAGICSRESLVGVERCEVSLAHNLKGIQCSNYSFVHYSTGLSEDYDAASDSCFSYLSAFLLGNFAGLKKDISSVSVLATSSGELLSKPLLKQNFGSIYSNFEDNKKYVPFKYRLNFMLNESSSKPSDELFAVFRQYCHAISNVFERTGNSLDVMYVVEYSLDFTREVSPETSLAKIWSKYLGPNPIPFDKEKRQAMIDKAKREHPDLGRHIEAWEIMNSPEYKAEQERKKKKSN